MTKPKEKLARVLNKKLRVVDAVTAVSAARWEASIRKVDCQIIRTDYRNREGSTLIRKFQNQSNILQEIPSDNELREGFHEAFVSLVREEPASDQLQLSIANTTGFSMGRPVVGRILIGTERVRLEASSAMHHQSLKAQFEKLAGSVTEFLREHRIDLVAQMLSRKSGMYDPSLVPAKLLENTSQMVLSTDLLPNNPDEPQRVALDA